MKRIVTKTILPVLVTTGVVAGALVTAKGIDNKNYSSEISNRKALNYTEKENELEVVQTASLEQEVTDATEKAEQAKTAKQEAEKEVEDAVSAINKAKNAVTAAKKELDAAKTKEEKAVAQAKIKKAEEEQRNAEKAKAEAEAKVEKAKEAVDKAEQDLEDARKKAEVAKPETTKQTESNTHSSTKMSTPSTIENPSSNEESTNTVDTIKNAITNTINANTLTVRNIKEKWTKEYDKNSGTELIVYHNGANDGSAIPAGVLYSYKAANGTTKTLFKEKSSSLWSIPNINDMKGLAGWTMQFSGTRTSGVIELELVKNLRFLINATPLTAEKLSGDAYKGMGSDVKFYRVAVSNSKFNEWLSKYYGDSVATDTVMIDIGINGNGYVCYLKGSVLGNMKTRNFEIVLANANNTHVPTANELNLNDDAVLELEKAYKKNYGCDIEWAKDNDGNDYYYWVCGPNKHADQSFLYKN